jgi:transcriptional regulator with XRE-family HTH domain
VATVSQVSGTAAPTARGARRSELAAFLRARRGRVRPEDVGLPPGLRRRTPGLRREEVAQLAGVGVTWYTWLEQGRPINASDQVLDAIARTLRLDGAERDHLYRLADLAPPGPSRLRPCPVPPAVQGVLDGMVGLPAVLYDARFDILANNAAYRALFPGVRRLDGLPRPANVLWCMFTTPGCCNPFLNRHDHLPQMVAVLRAGYGRHVGEPEWEEFVGELAAASPEFAEMWARHDVAYASVYQRVFRHAAVGVLRMTSSTFKIADSPETSMVVYTPEDAETREGIAWLLAHPGASPVDHTH